MAASRSHATSTVRYTHFSLLSHTDMIIGGDSTSSISAEETGNYHWGAWPAVSTASSSTTSTSFSSYTTTSTATTGTASTTNTATTGTGSTTGTTTGTPGGPGTTTTTGTSTTGAPGEPGNPGTTTAVTTTIGASGEPGSPGTTTASTTGAVTTTTTPLITTPATTTTTGGVTTTGGTTTTTTGADIEVIPAVEGQKFAIELQIAGLRKRAESAVGFSGDNAVIVDSAAAAYAFEMNNGILSIAGSAVTVGVAAAGSGVLGIQKISGDATNVMSGSWSLAGGSLNYPGANFCVKDGAFNVVFGALPSDCAAATVTTNANPEAFNAALSEAIAAAEPASTTTTTTTTTTATTTTAASATTTQAVTTTASADPTEPTGESPTNTAPAADPSADLDADPLPTARPRKRGGVLRRRQY